MDESEWLSVSECAARRGVVRSTVLRAIQRGELPAQRVGHGWVIRATNADKWEPIRDMAARGKRGGRPRKVTAEDGETADG